VSEGSLESAADVRKLHASCDVITFWGPGTSAMQDVTSGSATNMEPDSDIRVCLCSWISCGLNRVADKHRQLFENIRTVGALVNNSIQQNHSCKASRSSANQEIPRILRGKKLYYCLRKGPPLVSRLIQYAPSEPIYLTSAIILRSHLSSRRFNWSPFFRFP
jgi:hypothetical protein